MLEAKPDNDSNESLFADEKPTNNNRNNLTFDRKKYGNRQCYADS